MPFGKRSGPVFGRNGHESNGKAAVEDRPVLPSQGLQDRPEPTDGHFLPPNAEIPPGGREIADGIILYWTHSGHRYLNVETRQFFKGLTRILDNLPTSENLVQWIANSGSYENYQRKLEEARVRGSNVHKAIEDLLTGEKLRRQEFTPEEWNHLMTWRNFYEDYRPVVRAVEEPVMDTRTGIATMVDLRCDVAPPAKRGSKPGEKVHTVLNHKTSKSIYESSVLQNIEEARMANLALPENDQVVQAGIVRTGSLHARGYEYRVEQLVPETVERNHRLILALLELEKFREPEWRPKFPRPTPRELSLDLPEPEFDPEKL